MADIKTKDNIIVRGVPEGLEQSEQMKNYVANIRSTTGPGEYNFSQSPINEPSAQTERTPQEEQSSQFTSFKQIESLLPKDDVGQPKTTIE
ncbi:MAG: hypothetical protein WBA74_10465, partial [Cyclobacteriaceae bacterium]